MADTFDYAQGSANHPATQNQFMYRPEAFVDSAEQNHGAADICQLFNISRGMRVLDVTCEIITAEGGTLTIDVGITAVDADGFHDGFNGNAAAGVLVSSTGVYTSSTTNADLTTAVATGLYRLQGGYFHASSTADTIDALYNDAAATAQIRYTMAYMDMLGAMAFSPTVSAA